MYVNVYLQQMSVCGRFIFFGIDGKAVPNDYQQENKQLLQSKK